MSFAEATRMDLIEYLYALGFQPEKIRNNDYWYLSSLRHVKTASFKVNKELNEWCDHGIGKGGNLIDFALLNHHCPLHVIFKNSGGTFSFHQHNSSTRQLLNAGE